MSIPGEVEKVGTAGFWSYAHADDKRTKGKVLRLANEIGDAFSLLTGEEVDIFVDRNSLDWGDVWRKRIDQALQETTFFIPIVTPSFFLRQECRNELLKFDGYAKSLGAEELLLPILFVDVEDLDEDSADEAKALIASTQYVDWRELRMADENSERYLQSVNALAERLVEITRNYAAKPTLIPSELPPNDEVGREGDGGPGLFDLIAEMEEDLPRWAETVQAFPGYIEEVGRITKSWGEQLAEANSAGKGFAHRVVLFRKMAAELDGPARMILNLGEEYASQLVGVDRGMRALIALASSSDSPEGLEGAKKLFKNVLHMVEASNGQAGSLKELSGVMEGPARQSRDLRPVLNNIDSGLRGILDSQAVLDEWKRLILATEIIDPESS